MKSADILRKTSFFLILAAMLLCSITNGAIMWQNCIIPVILLCVAALLNKSRSSGIITDILIFVSLISCVLSVIFTKSDMQDGIYESFKYFCFAAAFFSGVSLGKENFYKLASILGIVLSIVGILSYCNIIRAAEYVFNDRGILRLQSLIRYANTAAVFLAVAYFSLGKWKGLNKKLSAFLRMLVLAALYLTVSKAAIPMFLIFGTFLMIKQQDADFAIFNMVSIAFVLPVILLARIYMFAPAFLVICVWVWMGVLLSGRVRYTPKIPAVCISAYIAAALGAVVLSVFGKFDLLSTFTFRLKYMEDALSLLPGGIFGNGPGSWQMMQYGVQQEQYNVTYIHNGWLQFLVENGFIFFAAFVGLVAICAYRMFKAKSWSSLVMLVFISAHSFVDIEFGFALTMIVFGLLCGSASEPSGNAFIPYAVIAMCIVMAGYGCSEYCVRYQFEKAYMEGDYKTALSKAYTLEKICPRDSDLQLNIAQLSGEDAEKRIKTAVSLSPYNSNHLLRYADFMISSGRDGVTDILEKVIRMSPKQESIYVEVKQLAQQARIYGIITESEYLEFIEKTDNFMESEGVVDRDRMLSEFNK